MFGGVPDGVPNPFIDKGIEIIAWEALDVCI